MLGVMSMMLMPWVAGITGSLSLHRRSIRKVGGLDGSLLGQSIINECQQSSHTPPDGCPP